MPSPTRSRLLPAVDLVTPAGGSEYPQILRAASYTWWRSLLGTVMGLSFFVLLTATVSQTVTAIAWSTGSSGLSYPDYASSAVAFKRPSGMLGANLGIATLIPISIVLMLLMHRMSPGWLSSVQRRIRWRYLLACLAIAAVALNGVTLLSTLVGPAVSINPQPGLWGFLVVIVLTSWLQAAAEEYFFRGYLMQAMGSLVAHPWFGVVSSSLIFALLHGTQNLPLFLDRLGFGLLAAALVWRTGGLEAGIAAHVINNAFAYIIAGLTSSIATIKAIQSIGWIDAAFDVGGFAVFALLAWLLARRMRIQRVVGLPELRPR
ncbi:MAG TPA: CPBP family intramembrane glutamic endopeptidase [Propionibacteriaceae bacterium]|nr:CPBP family intramembrane glutamic endopeptidase [Propionibacteriaceae bacterium]